jgi:hypothetical protein
MEPLHQPEPAARLDDPVIDTAAIDNGSAIAAVRMLIDEAKASLSAEVALAKTIGNVASQSLQRMALWGTIALLFAFVGLLALSIGLMIALAAVVGPLAAALIVGGLLLAVGLFAGLRARRNALILREATKLVLE